MKPSQIVDADVNRLGLVPSFNEPNDPLPPEPARLSYRRAYYHLVNVEEHPEILPLAHDLVRSRLDAAWERRPDLRALTLSEGDDGRGSLDRLLADLASKRGGYATPWRQPTEDLTRRQSLHFFLQYMPTAFVDACWLQCGLRVSIAHTSLGASITGMYAHQVRAFLSDPGRHFVADYRTVYGRLGAPLEEISSRSFSERPDLLEGSFGLPIFQLAIGQFTRNFPAEILGVNLAWQFLDLSAFGPELIRDVCKSYGLPSLGEDLGDSDHLEKARTMARDAALGLLARADAGGRPATWERLLRGVAAGLEAWTEWFDRAAASAPKGPPDPRQEMIDLLWRKAPHASGYHAERALASGKKIDEHLDPQAFDGPSILDDLARSRWVKPGNADRSAFLGRLIGFGGPMLAVFSPVEIQIIERWIDSLPPKDAEGRSAGGGSAAGPPPAGPTKPEELWASGRSWTREALGRRSARRYGECSVRELYHYLINVEFYPDILPVAERFARDRLERSMAMLKKGERPIPSHRYDPEALERWVYRKHREQVDSYRPPNVRPEAPKDAFIEATVQLAPLILIDGGWLQGIASPALIHTTVGRMLFHVLVEEIGEGRADEHHANIYRDLLAAMGEAAPPVETWEFAHWPRLRDSSFDVPALWLSISCFPRHFLPEILGLNLAVELAGIGGPYMEARDTLRRFGYPSLFVDVHNAADNVAAGHAAWAMNSIKRFLDEVAEREGPHSLDHTWHRVWTGVRATLPQIGRARLWAHRLGRRFFGEDPRLVPLIFPS